MSVPENMLGFIQYLCLKSNSFYEKFSYNSLYSFKLKKKKKKKVKRKNPHTF